MSVAPVCTAHPLQSRPEDPRLDLPPYAGQVRTYVVCASSRSGSTLLCDLLHGTERLGVPAEYMSLSPERRTRFAERLGVPPDTRLTRGTYLRALIRRRTSDEGFFGMKLLFGQLVQRGGGRTMHQLMRGSRLVWMRRRDRLAQAVSFSIAARTRRFSRTAGTEETVDPGAFDAILVNASLGHVSAEDTGWAVYFAESGITPYEVYYEDLLADTDRVCAGVCAHIGLADPPRFLLDQAGTARQESEINDAWRRAFLAHVGAVP